MAGKGLKTLAIDTATRYSSVALVNGDKVAGENLLYGQKNHSEKLLSLVDELFKNTRVAPGSIDLIAVSSGPGSFTGLRVGISTAQGLAFSLGKDLTGVSTLEVLASQVCCMYQGFICPMIDARKQQVYTCLYKCAEKGKLEKVIGETVVGPEKWLLDLPAPVLFLGDGVCSYRKIIKTTMKKNCTILPFYFGIPRASTLAHIAMKRYLKNRRNELEQIAPMYIRPPDAEMKTNIRKGSFNPVV
jgi:tRNA threonylcarbamoyladenosine biosynthesis protein TsaB